MNQLADKEYWQIIWDKFRAGDTEAFETIYNEFIDALFSYGSRITSDKVLLEDAIQDLFVDIYSYNSVLRKPESLEYYLFIILKRIIYKKLKEKNRFSHTEYQTVHFELIFEIEKNEQETSDECLIKLQTELQKFDAKKRELLFLKFNSGLTYEEIGNIVNRSPGAVKKQVHRMLNTIRKNLDQFSIFLFFY